MWILPVRGRPAMCRDALSTMIRHGSTAKGAVILSLDDPCIDEYRAITLPKGWTFCEFMPVSIGVGDPIRHAFSTFPDEPWYGLMADDIGVETDGFEPVLIAAAGSYGIASGNDLWQADADIAKGRMHGAAVFGGELLRALGYWTPAGFGHVYIEDVWETLGRELGNWRILMDVVTPHNHPFKAGGRPMDKTTAEANADERYRADGSRFATWRRDESAADILRVRTAMWAAKGLDLDLARSRSVVMAVPVYRDISPWHYAAMIQTLDLLKSLGIRYEVKVVAGVPVTDARNALANRFMETNHSDLLFIDADEGWDPWSVVRLLATGLPFVGAVGRKKTNAPDGDLSTWCFLPLVTDGTVPITDAGMVEVDAVGTGFLLVNRSVFDAMKAVHPEWARGSVGSDTGQFTEFFACDLDETGVSRHGEDISFCHRWRAMGGRVFIDPTISISHYGTHEYGGSIARFFEHPAIPA